MLQRALAFALTLMTAGVWLPPETATAQSRARPITVAEDRNPTFRNPLPCGART